MISNLVTCLRIALLIPLCVILLTTGGSGARWLALGIFLAAGLTDILDGWLARTLREVSALGAMLDLIADRLLTLVVLGALIASGELKVWGVAAALVLIARDLIVASFGEALSDRLNIGVSTLERVKITLHFFGMALLIAPDFWYQGLDSGLHVLGTWFLVTAAVLAALTVVDYTGQTVEAFADRL